MDENTETIDSPNDETTAEAETTESEELDVAALKAKAAKADELEATNRQLFERAKKAEGFVKVDGKWVKAPKPEEAIAAVAKLEAKTGELDETQLDYLDLKGITDDDEIQLIQKVMRNTGQTVRQALKDDYVQSKLETLRKEKEVKSATPSSTKRSGNQIGDVEAAIAKYQQSGALPDDFALRTAVVNAVYERENKNKPAWK